MDPFVARVARFAVREKLFRNAKRVMVAVSGGPDSVATLLCLLELRERFGFEVLAVHFDHQLREGSAGDRAWVAALCERLEVPCFTGEGDVAGFAKAQRLGTEDAARRMRYQFMAFVAAEKRADCLATGHTADDQAETVLMRVVRGTGVRGLRAMLPASGVPGAEAQRLIRPLLEVGRAETRAFCESRGIEPLSDPSNSDLAYTRNQLRAVTLPALEALNPSVHKALIGLSASARELFADVERASYAVQPTVRGPVGSILALPAFAALQNEALTLVIEREASFYKLSFEVNRTRLENLRTVLRARSGSVAFGGVVVEVSVGLVRIGPPIGAGEPFSLRLKVPGVAIGNSWHVNVGPSSATEPPGAVRVATAAANRGLTLRSARPGDRISFHGLERKVSDLYAVQRVPSWERAGAAVIANSDGVHALLTASGVFAADIRPGTATWEILVSGA